MLHFTGKYQGLRAFMDGATIGKNYFGKDLFIN
jgi:hypothetical protein